MLPYARYEPVPAVSDAGNVVTLYHYGSRVLNTAANIIHTLFGRGL